MYKLLPSVRENLFVQLERLAGDSTQGRTLRRWSELIRAASSRPLVMPLHQGRLELPGDLGSCESDVSLLRWQSVISRLPLGKVGTGLIYAGPAVGKLGKDGANGQWLSITAEIVGHRIDGGFYAAKSMQTISSWLDMQGRSRVRTNATGVHGVEIRERGRMRFMPLPGLGDIARRLGPPRWARASPPMPLWCASATSSTASWGWTIATRQSDSPPRRKTPEASGMRAGGEASLQLVASLPLLAGREVGIEHRYPVAGGLTPLMDESRQ